MRAKIRKSERRRVDNRINRLGVQNSGAKPAHQAAGKVKEAAGKVTGDEKLRREGQAEHAAGKVQNAVGGVKDAVRKAAHEATKK